MRQWFLVSFPFLVEVWILCGESPCNLSWDVWYPFLSHSSAMVFDVDLVTFYFFLSILLSLIQFDIASQKPNHFSCCPMSS